MTGTGEEVANGWWFWIEDEDVGVVREGVSESECVCQTVCATEGARVAATEGARRKAVKSRSCKQRERNAQADDGQYAGTPEGLKWSEMGE